MSPIHNYAVLYFTRVPDAGVPTYAGARANVTVRSHIRALVNERGTFNVRSRTHSSCLGNGHVANQVSAFFHISESLVLHTFQRPNVRVKQVPRLPNVEPIVLRDFSGRDRLPMFA